jgi:hypothetical protein
MPILNACHCLTRVLDYSICIFKAPLQHILLIFKDGGKGVATRSRYTAHPVPRVARLQLSTKLPRIGAFSRETAVKSRASTVILSIYR